MIPTLSFQFFYSNSQLSKRKRLLGFNNLAVYPGQIVPSSKGPINILNAVFRNCPPTEEYSLVICQDII